MYISYIGKDFQKMMGVSNNYRVDKCIISGTWDLESRMVMLKKILPEDVEIKQLSGFFSNVFSFQLYGKEIRFAVAYGSAYTSEVCHIACLLGSQENILIGSCGCLHQEIENNSVIIPRYSYCNESSARIYSKNKDHLQYGSAKLGSLYQKKLLDNDIYVSNLPTVTCQGMLGETREDIERWVSKGYGGVEMEAGTVFAVSSYFNVDSIAMLQVADNLIKKETVLSESFEKKRANIQQLRIFLYKLAIGVD